MVGTINMTFEEVNEGTLGTKINVDVENVDFKDKCIAVENFIRVLAEENAEKIVILKAVTRHILEGEMKNEG